MIPCVITATNMTTLTPVEYRRGPVLDAVLASMGLMRVLPSGSHPDFPNVRIRDTCYSDNSAVKTAINYVKYLVANNVSPPWVSLDLAIVIILKKWIFSLNFHLSSLYCFSRSQDQNHSEKHYIHYITFLGVWNVKICDVI